MVCNAGFFNGSYQHGAEPQGEADASCGIE